MCGRRVRAEGRAIIVPALRPPLVWLAGRHHFSCVEHSPPTPMTRSELFWPGELCSLHPGDSLGIHPTQLVQHQRHFCVWCLSALQSFLNNSQVHRLQVASSWPQCSLRLSQSGPRLRTGVKSESALTHWTPLIPHWSLPETPPHLTHVPLKTVLASCGQLVLDNITILDKFQESA